MIRRHCRLLLAILGLGALASSSYGDEPPKAVLDRAVEVARVVGGSGTFDTRSAELVVPERTKLPRSWTIRFDHCMVTVSEPDGQFETFRAGGERGERSWETVRETIPNGATGRVYATPRERETKLRAICDELGLNVREWQFKDLSRSYTGHPLLQRSRLYEPMYGYDGDGNYVDAVFEMYHGSVMSVIHSYGWTVTPPPDSMVAPEDAVLLAKAAVERKSAEIQSRGGTALEWPGDAQAKARSKLWYVRVVINDWISDEMRAHLGKKTLRLARSYSHADWFVLLDAETGHVLGGGQTIGYSPVAGRAGGPPGTERAQGPTLPPAGVLVAALCALAGVGAWIAVRRKAR